MTLRQDLLIARGLLAEQKKRYSDLDVEASGLVFLVRNALHPYQGLDVVDLKVEEAASAAARLEKALRAKPIYEARGLSLRLGVSCGVAGYPWSGEDIAQGVKIYYEAASAKLTAIAGSNTLCGRAIKAAGASDATVIVAFNGLAAA